MDTVTTVVMKTMTLTTVRTKTMTIVMVATLMLMTASEPYWGRTMKPRAGSEGAVESLDGRAAERWPRRPRRRRRRRMTTTTTTTTTTVVEEVRG